MSRYREVRRKQHLPVGISALRQRHYSKFRVRFSRQHRQPLKRIPIRGRDYWLRNNSEVGLWYTITAFAFLLFGGLLALAMRIQLAFPDNSFLTADQYNQVFTMHGSVMMFLFAVPILEAISILLLPQMMGARDLPFPRLSAYGFWSFLIGGVFVCGSLLFGVGPRGGWFMYPPMTTQYQTDVGADIWLLGLSFIEIASIAAAVELIVGVLKCRPPGMRLNLIPLYAWYILVVAAMILFAFPPLIAGDLLMELERALDWPFFDASRGGDPMLWQHLFWIFGHPEVYIVFLPSIALVAMIVPTFARTPMVGYGWIVLAAVGTGFLSFGLWVHHMFTTGLPGITIGIFSAASEAVAIPTGVQIFCFIATLLIGRVTKSVCLLFVLAGLATFIIGGLTGVMVAIAPFDYQAHDTYFIVGHLHYVLVGGTIFPIVAGCYYFFPLVTGKQLSERLGTIAFWLMLLGFNVSFFPMHISGLLGMPRRVYTYPAGMGFDNLNLISSIGAFVLAGGFVVFLWDVLRPKGKQPLAPRNVWNAGTLEWLAEVPDQPWGVRSIPTIESRYPLWDQNNFVRDVDEGNFYLADAEEGLRETLVTSTVEATPIQCLRVPGPTFLTLWAAVFTGGVFIFGTFHWYIASSVSGLLAFFTILAWLWTGTAIIPEKTEKDVGLGLTLPIYVSGPDAVGWWAMFITMLADMTAFMSLVFGYFFYWTVHENFPPKDAVGPGVLWPLVAVVSAWPTQKRDEEICPIVAFLRELRNMDAARYLELNQPEFEDHDKETSRISSLTQSCITCHNPRGSGSLSPRVPILSGQNKEYLRRSLLAYKTGNRHSGVMMPIAHRLTDKQFDELATYFSKHTADLPLSVNSQPNDAIEKGRVLAHQGNQSMKIPSCVDCHGPGEISRSDEYPKLAGQPAWYLRRQLELFVAQHRGGSDNASLMHPIANKLDDSQRLALSEYYASLNERNEN